MSARRDLFDRVVELRTRLGLDQPYAIEGLSRPDARRRRHRYVSVAVPGLLDGLIEIWSTTWILVKWRGLVPGEPFNDKRILRSEEELSRFMRRMAPN